MRYKKHLQRCVGKSNNVAILLILLIIQEYIWKVFVIIRYIIELIEYIIEMMFLFETRLYVMSINCTLEA